MGTFGELHYSNQPNKQELLRIDHRRGRIEASLTLHKFIDKDTNQIVHYIPILDITSYGETDEKATEMLRFCMDDLFGYLINLSPKLLKIELSKLGWKQSTFRNKEYSKAYVDIHGELKNLNAVEDKVERLTLIV